MIEKIFLWFYCLSTPSAVIIVITITVIYLYFRNFFVKKRSWRPSIVALFLLWLAVIAAATLMDRMSGTLPLYPELIPFHSYRAVMAGGNKEILRSNFMNVVLFYPAGLLGCELLPKDWGRVKKVILTAALFALLSAGIEFCQYHFALGQAEVDDVIHNTLGAFIGALVGTIPFKKE